MFIRERERGSEGEGKRRGERWAGWRALPQRIQAFGANKDSHDKRTPQ